MWNRLFPRQADNTFAGHRAALWLLGLFIALKLVMSINSMVNTASVAAGADGLPLDSYGPAAAQTVLLLFALLSLGHLALAVIALTILIRYRAMVPFIYLVLLGEHLARRFVVASHAVTRIEDVPLGWYVNVGLLILLSLGLVLSLLPARQRAVAE
jgi:hypothetical protein